MAKQNDEKVDWPLVLKIAVAILSAILGALGEAATHCAGSILNIQ